MKQLFVTAFFMAWGMFWVVPCPVKRWDENERVGMLLFFPVIGLLIGLVWAVFALLRDRFLPGLLGGAILTVIPYVLSGGIHLDGYLDCADAVFSRRSREGRLAILKDAHVGSFAVMAAAALFLLEFAALSEGRLGLKCWCLPFVCAAPRACAAAAVLFLPPLPGSSYETMSSRGVESGARMASLGILLILVLLPLLLFGAAGLSALVGAAAAAGVILWIRHDLGGMSGDVSGAGVTVGELCAVAALTLLG